MKNVLLALLALNIATVAFCEWARSSGPVENVVLSTQGDYLLLYGNNTLNMKSLKVFGSWPQMQDYLSNNDLSLPSICDACGTPQTLSQSSFEDSKIRTEWTRSPGKVLAFEFPDSASADVFSDYLYYNQLSPSPLGYAIRLR